MTSRFYLSYLRLFELGLQVFVLLGDLWPLGFVHAHDVVHVDAPTDVPPRSVFEVQLAGLQPFADRAPEFVETGLRELFLPLLLEGRSE